MKYLLKNKAKATITALLMLLPLFLITVTEEELSAVPARPVPERLVNDLAGILDTRQEYNLEMVLEDFYKKTSNQIAVVTVNDLEGFSPAEYGTEIGIRWEVGSARFDNGIVILVKPKSLSGRGEVNISVGYGLEAPIPDSYAKRIIENEMIPHFRNNDYYSGIASACSVLMKLASGEISEPVEGSKGGEFSVAGLFFALFFIIIFFSILFGKPKNGGGNGNGGNDFHRNDMDDFTKAIIIGSLLNSGRGGHYNRGGFGGGGFGGGNFGGGFGGFGGGSFGGGGASGSW